VRTTKGVEMLKLQRERRKLLAITEKLVDERDRLRREKADLEAALIAILLDINLDSMGSITIHDSTRGEQALSQAKSMIEKAMA
jgi:hypothetical protein